jgi:putative 4-mercaptohistidine N1-methyltranferase
MNPYETDKLLHEYLLFHYGRAEEVLPWSEGPQAALDYPARCVTECLDATALPRNARALDIGCAVGRATFELARFCREVIGIDYSERFIEAARSLAADGVIGYLRADEGMLTTSLEARVPEGVNRAGVRFQHGDAHALPSELGVFDVVLAANLIDRLEKPRHFLSQLSRLVKSGGQLIITSPYTWLLEYTPLDEWIGGCTANGKERNTLDGLKEALSGEFTLVTTKDLPFLIREHARKFQWSVAQASIWQRRS